MSPFRAASSPASCICRCQAMVPYQLSLTKIKAALHMRVSLDQLMYYWPAKRPYRPGAGSGARPWAAWMT